MPGTRTNAADGARVDEPGLSIREDVAVAADALWAILKDFGGLVAWNPFVTACETFRDGGKLLRIVETSEGVRLCERADLLDSRRRKLVYTVLSSDPARPSVGRVATILIDRINDAEARITWSLQQKGFNFAPEQADTLGAGIRARIKALASAAAKSL